MSAIKILPGLLLVITLTANAQKLPNVQQVSLRAPVNIKVDGKATEWNNQFQAYNTHTDFYYTMANDDKNLYVVIQATDPTIIRRIINGGVTLTIDRSGKKKDKDGMSITYPVFDKDNKFIPSMGDGGGRVGVASLMRRAVSSNMNGGGDIIIDEDNSTMDTRGTVVNKSGAAVNKDSLALINNNNMANKAKYIRVNGIKDVDSLISVYNADGIKTAALFDNKLAYTYELAIALRQLNLSVNSHIKFAYQLMINKVTISVTKFVIYNPAGEIVGQGMHKNGNGPQAGQPATDFWGEYTLAK